MNSDIDHMLNESPKKVMDESFEERSRESEFVPVPELIPEKPLAPSKNQSIDAMIPLIISSLPI